MIAMTNANMKNLPTTPPPAPQKSWDKRDRAVKAAILALGPEAMEKTDFTIERDGKRFVWKAVPADKRPAPTAQQVKANGGKAATVAALTLSDADRIAGEAVTAAALAKKTADKIAAQAKGTPAEKLATEIADKAGERLSAALGTPGNPTAAQRLMLEDGAPECLVFRGQPETVEAQKTRIEKFKKTTGPDRQIKNPPNVKDAKKRAAKEKGKGVGFTAREAILAGKTNDEALAIVMKAHPTCGSNVGCMGWYRNDLRKKGLLKDGKQPKARPTKKAAKK